MNEDRPEIRGGSGSGPDDPTRSSSDWRPEGAGSSGQEAERIGGTPDPGGTAEDFPARLGRYTLRRMIASGGMGTVFEAEQDQPRRTVAVKVMHGGATSRGALERFERESQVLALLRHPSIAQVFEAGTQEDGGRGIAWFAMELVPGARTITEYCDAKGLGPRERLGLVVSVCRAAHHAHERGVVHRDIKPSNVLVDGDGAVKLIDFGVSRLAGAAGPATRIGAVMGTPSYMAPEQARGESDRVDRRADVYAIGGVLRELVGPGGGPPEVRAIIGRAMHPEASRRYESAAELAADIERFLNDEPVRARPDGLLYRARVAVRMASARRPFALCAAMVLAGALLAERVLTPAVIQWTPLDRWFVAGMERAMGGAKGAAIESARLIVLSDATDVGRSASAAGLDGVSASEPRSLRALHGRLMARLAEAGPTVVAWDVMFRGESAFDEAFLGGVRALRSRGVTTVVGARDWAVNEDGLPAVCPAILAETAWGPFTAMTESRPGWRLDVVMQRGREEARLGLMGAAFGAARRSGQMCAASLDPATAVLTLRYWTPSAVAPGVRRFSGASDQVRLTAVLEQPRPEPAMGLEVGDQRGILELTLPSDEALRAATVNYEDAIGASAHQLREWLGGRAVIVADTRGPADWHATADGRRLPGCVAHLAGFEAMWRASAVRRPDPATWLGISLLGATVGGVAGWSSPRANKRVSVMLVIVVLGVAASVGVYAVWGLRVDALVPLAGALLAAEGCAAVARVRGERARGTQTPTPRSA